MFRASKYRNVLGSNVPREEWYEELQLDDGRLDVYPVATNLDQIAFVSQLNSGGVIEVKDIKDTGKANAMQKPRTLLRGHAQRVNALSFNPYDNGNRSILVSGGDDNTVKLWHIDGQENPCISTYTHDTQSRILNLAFHPSASNVLGVGSTHSVFVLDVETQSIVCNPFDHPDLVTGFAWKTDGSMVVSVCQDNIIRGWDPRQPSNDTISFQGNQGRKPAAITWCKDDTFITAGFNAMQEREIVVWDIKKPGQAVVRERIDSGTGLLIPLFDEDTNLLFVAGRGDKSIRTYELANKRPYLTLLQQTGVSRSTWGLGSLPKRACAVENCEIARVFNVGGSSLEPISYTVPRRETTFQADLFPDSRGDLAAITHHGYLKGENALPILKPVHPRVQVQTTPVFAATPSVSSTADWNSASGWGAPPPPLPPASTQDVPVPQDPLIQRGDSVDESMELSAKAKKLGSIQGHKLKYITGKPWARSASYAKISGIDDSLLVANGTYFASPLLSGGGIAVQSWQNGPSDGRFTTLQGHKSAVTAVEFDPFKNDLLITGSDDSTAKLWNVNETTPRAELRGHERGLRCISFHPSASDIVATGGMDNTIRLWDLQTSECTHVVDKFEDIPFNISFNYDGSAFATISRDRVLRVIDSRSSVTAAMACAHEGTKQQQVVWCTGSSGNQLFTVGFTARSERQVALWDARNLLDPVTMVNIDSSSSILMPFYDESSHAIYLVGRGDRSILTYEIDTNALLPCTPYMHTGSSISAAAMLPKQVCNIRDVEVARFFILTKSSVEPISLSVPRADKLQSYFQDDLFSPIRASTPAITAADWREGKSATPNVISLCPPDMKPLSQRVVEEKPSVPKVLTFKAEQARQEQEQRERDANFARLQALASQPSLHSQRKHVDDDEDDGWDD